MYILSCFVLNHVLIEYVHTYICSFASFFLLAPSSGMAADPSLTSVMQVVVDLPTTSLTASVLTNLMVAIQLELERNQLDDVELKVTDLYQLGPE